MVKFSSSFVLVLSASLLLSSQCIAGASADPPCPRDNSLPSVDKCDPKSVVSIDGKSFCTRGSICSSDNPTGNCPGPQEGLDFGSECTQDGYNFRCVTRKTCPSIEPHNKCGVKSDDESTPAPSNKGRTEEAPVDLQASYSTSGGSTPVSPAQSSALAPESPAASAPSGGPAASSPGSPAATAPGLSATPSPPGTATTAPGPPTTTPSPGSPAATAPGLSATPSPP
ncbi:hypothetical protein Gpo141_00011254, partial [Globisporangium polare]